VTDVQALKFRNKLQGMQVQHLGSIITKDFNFEFKMVALVVCTCSCLCSYSVQY